MKVSFLFFSLLATSALYSQISLQSETVVTATRLEEEVKDVASSVSVIGQDELLESAARTLPESLHLVPSVMVQKTAHGHGSPFIRGFTAFRNLMMVDGVRFNNSVFRDGPNQYWSMIDSYKIDQLELVRGPGSVLYGSDAIGGTVNVLTKSSGYLEEDEGAFFQNGSLYQRFDTNSESHVTRVEQVFGVGGQWGLTLGASFKDFGDFDAAGLGEQRFTGYDEWSADVKFEVSLSEGARLTLSHQRVDQDDIWRTHRTIFGESWEGTTVGNELARILDQEGSLSYAKLEGNLTERTSYVATLSYQELVERRFRERSGSRFDRQGFDVETWGGAIQFATEITDKLGLVYGADYYRDSVDSFRVDDDNREFSSPAVSVQGPVGDDAVYELFGAYLEGNYQLNDQWQTSLGGRYTYARADIGTVLDPGTGLGISLDDSWNDVSFAWKVLYQASDEWTHFASVSQSFRAPNLSDLSRNDDVQTDSFETSATNLDPEKFLSLELGTRYDSENLSTFASVYYTDMRDLIVRSPTGALTASGETELTKTNASDGYVWGIEFGFEYALTDQWKAFGGASWMEGYADAFPGGASATPVEEPLSRVMPFTAHLGLRYTSVDERWWAEAVVRGADKANRLSSLNEADTSRIPPGGTPGYVTASIRGGYQVNDHLQLNLSIENLNDEEYRVHGSGQNETGINAIFGAKLSW